MSMQSVKRLLKEETTGKWVECDVIDGYKNSQLYGEIAVEQLREIGAETTDSTGPYQQKMRLRGAEFEVYSNHAIARLEEDETDNLGFLKNNSPP